MAAMGYSLYICGDTVCRYIAMSTTVHLPQSRHSPLYASHKSLIKASERSSVYKYVCN